MKKKPLVSICIPTYNSELLIGKALDSVFAQSYTNFEIIISDDCSTDKTVSVVKAYRSEKIKIHTNKKNLGYGDNLKNFKKLVSGEIIFLLAQDDILINDGLNKTVRAFTSDPKVGVVTRPYYWFAHDPQLPIRHIPPINRLSDVKINVQKKPKAIIPIIESVGQLSGLAYRTDLFTQFHSDVFPAHIYPFMEILKDHLCVFLSDYTIAVGTYDSQTRFKSSIYDSSPTASWLKMFETVFQDNCCSEIRNLAIDHMAQNYLGLVQLKNYGKSPKILYREIWILIKARPSNLLSPKFWFFSLGTIIVPRCILIYMVDNFKEKILSKKITTS